MSETNPVPNATDKQTQADAASSPELDWGVGHLLNAQADMLAGAEATVGDWLHRRQAAVADTRQLLASMHPGVAPGDLLRAQREFVSHWLQRLAADVDDCQAAAQHFMDHAPALLPPGGWVWLPWATGTAETNATRAAATRAAGKPLRMANRSE
jgi:hypothetical protein